MREDVAGSCVGHGVISRRLTSRSTGHITPFDWMLLLWSRPEACVCLCSTHDSLLCDLKWLQGEEPITESNVWVETSGALHSVAFTVQWMVKVFRPVGTFSRRCCCVTATNRELFYLTGFYLSHQHREEFTCFTRKAVKTDQCWSSEKYSRLEGKPSLSSQVFYNFPKVVRTDCM